MTKNTVKATMASKAEVARHNTQVELTELNRAIVRLARSRWSTPAREQVDVLIAAVREEERERCACIADSFAGTEANAETIAWIIRAWE